jgi:NAD(P)-dependent dehydrogenase (short-subunit alcohol dehydrogenase family)
VQDYLKYEDKVCVVTGAASGMGKATAEMLVDLGARVYALDWARIEVPGITTGYHVDLGKKADIDEVFADLPSRIDAYFGVAGVSGQQHDYNTTVTINFVANKYITDTYLEDRMNEGGAIAYITSTAGLNWEKYSDEVKAMATADGWDATVAELEKLGMAQVPGPAAYPLSKRATNYYATSRVGPFAAKKVRVNIVLPASTDTGLTDDFVKSVGSMDALIAYSGYAGRLATAREMAQPLVFLNSPMASYVSGVGLIVDYGARTMSLLGIAPDPLDTPMLAR